MSAEIPGIKNEDEYVAAARELSRQAASRYPGTEVKVRERRQGDLAVQDYLIWYQPPRVARGLFLVIKDCGDHGEVETMFPPLDGKAYFEQQVGDVVH